MKRREFLTASVAATAALAASGCASTGATEASAPHATKQEYYELRVFRMKPGQSSEVLQRYLEKAAIPALNRQGLKPIGVFSEIEKKDPETLFVLIPYPSLEVYSGIKNAMAKDATYQAAAADYKQLPKTSPAYDRFDSWLLLAFAGMPKIKLPSYSPNGASRIFELRTYESYSQTKAQKKVDMFNDGEIDVMHEVGLGPIFFGQALMGANLPHLTYMTSGENEAAHKQHWDAFGKHPKWEQMKNDPQYADTVSRMSKWMLRPTAYSQI